MRTISQHDSNRQGATRSGALTVRGIDPSLRAALEAEATRLGLSLNAVILRLLQDALGLVGSTGLAHDLDDLAGSWTPGEAQEFAVATEAFEQIDQSIWNSRLEPS
jgi:acetate kinase